MKLSTIVTLDHGAICSSHAVSLTVDASNDPPIYILRFNGYRICDGHDLDDARNAYNGIIAALFE